jgi:hypothetical protein
MRNEHQSQDRCGELIISKRIKGCLRVSSDTSDSSKSSTGEFDPGSERTLAARYSGARVSNTWVICLRVGDNIPKGVLIPHKTTPSKEEAVKAGLYI